MVNVTHTEVRTERNHLARFLNGRGVRIGDVERAIGESKFDEFIANAARVNNRIREAGVLFALGNFRLGVQCAVESRQLRDAVYADLMGITKKTTKLPDLPRYSEHIAAYFIDTYGTAIAQAERSRMIQ